MPIYEYSCGRCGKTFENLVVRRADEEGVHCPECGSQKVARQMSRPADSRTSGFSGGSRVRSGCKPSG